MIHECVNVVVAEDGRQAEPELVLTPDIPLMKEQLSKVNEKAEKGRKKDLAEEEAVIQEILSEFFA